MSGVIFDMDGTILDSLSLWENIVERYMRSLSLPVEEGSSKAILRMSLSEGIAYIHENFLPEKSEQEISDGIFGLVQGAYAHDVLAKEGMAQFILAMHAAGVPLCVATSNGLREAQSAFTRLGLYDCFVHVFTSDEVPEGKSNPLIYLKAAQAMHSPVGDTWVLEDSPHAIKSAKAAGFKVVVVKEEYWKEQRQELEELADFRIDCASDLERLFDIITKHKN